MLSEEDRESLTAYLDGELDEPSRQTLEARIHRDGELRKELDTLKQTWGMLDYLPKPAASVDFTNRTMDRLAVEVRSTVSTRLPKPSRWKTKLGWSAAAVLALVAGFFGGARLAHLKEEPIVRQLRVIERWRLYENIDDLDYLRSLDQPDLFGEDLDS